MSLPTWGRQLYWFCPLHLSAVISVQILRKGLSQRLKSAWVENPNPFWGQWVKGQGHRGQTCEICLISKLAYTLSRRLITERMFSLHEYNPNCFWGQWVKGQGSKCEICFHSNLAHYDRDFKFIQWLVGLSRRHIVFKVSGSKVKVQLSLRTDTQYCFSLHFTQ